MRPFLIIIIILIAGFFVSCEKDDSSDVVKMRVNHYQQPVNMQELYMGLSLIVQEEEEIGTENWTRFCNGIEGLDYELGYIYDIKVEKKKIEHLVIDGPAYEYKLLEVISKTKVPDDTTFEVILAINFNPVYENYVTKDENSTFYLYYDIIIETGSLSTNLSENIENEVGMIGVFKHIDSKTLQLIELKPYSY